VSHGARGAALAVAAIALASCQWPLCDESCGDGKRCIDGACVPDPCAGRDCGPDGYGGSCGECAGVCRDGRCRTCPAETVRVGSQPLCIDRWEASRGKTGDALSAAGVPPWRRVTWTEARQACALSGKRLCTKAEWQAACIGPLDCGFMGLSCVAGVFPYGTTFEEDRCWGAAKAGEPERTAPLAAGSMPRCEGGYPGLFDMSGNLREWVSDCTTYSCNVLGGSFRNSNYTLSCNANSSLSDGITAHDWSGSDGDTVGFRCCAPL
jgi:hypothetical protein